MERVRLLGLVLFITAVLLALATGVWDTQHVNVEGFPRLESFSQRVESTDVAPGVDSRGQSVRPEGSSVGSVQQAAGGDADRSGAVASLPTVWLLAAAGAVGLLLWFLPSSSGSKKIKRTRGRRKR